MTTLKLCAAALAAMLGVATANAQTEKKDSVDYSLNLKEFVVKPLCDYKEVKKCRENAGILGGVELPDGNVAIAVTEKRTKAEIDRLVELMTE